MNLTAIIAVVMVAMSSINLVSCTADEEYEDLSFGTLANGMFTRTGEPDALVNNDIVGFVEGKDFQISSESLETTIKVDIEIRINTTNNSATCEVTKIYDTSIAQKITATAKNINIDKQSCDITLHFSTVEYGKCTSESTRVSYKIKNN